MNSLEHIRKPIEADMARYESYLKDSFHSDYPFIQSILDHIISGRGKGIRPLLAMLSAALHNPAGESLPRQSSLAAMLVEMIHNASLVHDDIVDEAFIRRGKASVNAVWKSSAAVLVGDYILARCYSIGLENNVYSILSYITRSMIQLCEGELIQSDQSEHLEMTREIYYDIIHKKTATLIGTSCAVGALSVAADQSQVEAIKSFGDMLGMAFQIKDDILDYSHSSQTGKPSCGDIKERKINLPMLMVLENASASERTRISDLMEGVSDNPLNVDLLCRMVVDAGGIDQAAVIMQEYISKALEIIQTYPQSPVRASLEELCAYVARRHK